MRIFKLVAIITALCLFPSLACSEEWQIFMGDGKGANDFYFDKGSVTRSGENVTVSTKNVLPGGYVLTKVEINCSENTFKGLSRTEHDKSGKTKDDVGPMLNHSAISQGSILNDLKKLVCAK